MKNRKKKKMPERGRATRWNLRLIRCFVQTGESGFELPAHTNATLISGDYHWARVLLDHKSRPEVFNWDWISFNEGELKRALKKKESPGRGL